jgi:hypothetical protein
MSNPTFVTNSVNFTNSIVIEFYHPNVLLQNPLTHENKWYKKPCPKGKNNQINYLSDKLTELKSEIKIPDFITITNIFRKNIKNQLIPIYICNFNLIINDIIFYNPEVRYTLDDTNYWYIYNYRKRNTLSIEQLHKIRYIDKQNYINKNETIINCICGSILEYNSIYSHKKSKKHQNYFIKLVIILNKYILNDISKIITNYLIK